MGQRRRSSNAEKPQRSKKEWLDKRAIPAQDLLGTMASRWPAPPLLNRQLRLFQLHRQSDRLQREIHRLVEAARDGCLSERGRVEQFEGNSGTVLHGVNEMLDAILLPIVEGTPTSTLRGGNLRERGETACKGDHELMKNLINGQQSWLTDLITYITKIVNGDLALRWLKLPGRTRFMSGWCC